MSWPSSLGISVVRSLASPAAFEALCEKAAKIEWVVHVKPPFGGPQRVLKYLARYTHRVAISNHRLRALENGRVSFEWKDYAHHSQRKIMTLDAVEFMRRFLLHVLPSGLVRIRQFGFLANRFRTRNLQLCRDLLAVRQTPALSRFPQPCRYQCSRSLVLSDLQTRAVDHDRSHPPRTGYGSGHFMTLSRDLSSSSFHIPRRASADLCLHVVTLRVQVCSAASPAISYRCSHPFARLPLCRFRHSEPRVPRQNAIQYPVDSYRLSSMNSIGSAHADLTRRPRRCFRVSTPDRMLFIIGSMRRS